MPKMRRSSRQQLKPNANVQACLILPQGAYADTITQDSGGGNTLYGFMMPCGSSAAFTARMTATAAGGLLYPMQLAFINPSPCSALTLPRCCAAWQAGQGWSAKSTKSPTAQTAQAAVIQQHSCPPRSASPTLSTRIQTALSAAAVPRYTWALHGWDGRGGCECKHRAGLPQAWDASGPLVEARGSAKLPQQHNTWKQAADWRHATGGS